MKCKWLILLCGALLFSGCGGVDGVITDVSGNKTVVKDIRFENSRMLKVLDGSSLRNIKLSVLEKVSIYPQSTKSADGDIFYNVKMMFSNSSAHDLTYGKESNKENVYLSVTGELTGRSKGGKYRIALDRVSEIYFIK